MPLRALLLLAAGFAATAAAADWPQWSGPHRDGKSADTGLLKEWPKDGPRLLWKIDTLGGGYSAPAVVGDRIYVLGGDSATAIAKEYLICLNVADGKEVWRTTLNDDPKGPKSLGQNFATWGGGPRSTPAVDSELVYALGATGDLVCVNRKDGKVVWKKNLVSDFGGGVPNWGYTESPLVDGGRVVVTPGGNKGAMIALDKNTGNPLWRCEELTDPANYSSVVIAEVGGVRQYVQQTAKSAVGVRANDGKLLWKEDQLRRRTAVIPTPVVVKGDHVFFTSGYGAGCELIKLEPDGAGGTKATVVYTRNPTVSNHHGGVVEHDGYIYGHNNRQWVCFDPMKGGEEPVWSSNALGKGSVSFADGYLYCYVERDGTLARVKATPDGWQEAGRFTLPVKSAIRPGSGKVWPHPVIANGRLYLRDTEYLCCFDLRQPGA
ncbi:MAG TPA: PQQ-binding-like beta-propeller repeat protein [Fimbriiglobus sp.]|nr:PQQ-binding-like beta-propeller repeat protein [Fimbriiglobus sp.]